MRSVQEVFDDYLRLRLEGRLEEDLVRNYSEDVILLTSNSDMVGHDALRISAARLAEQLPEAEFHFVAKQVHGEFALLVWQARSQQYRVSSGADSFVIRHGRIVFQSIHYDLIDAESSRRKG